MRRTRITISYKIQHRGAIMLKVESFIKSIVTDPTIR